MEMAFYRTGDYHFNYNLAMLRVMRQDLQDAFPVLLSSFRQSASRLFDDSITRIQRSRSDT